jgi:hypothetical protein
MMTLECQHCGAKLALEGPKVPAEVRCKRCGRRSSTAGAVKAQAPKPRTEAEPPTAGISSPPIPPPPTSYPPSDVRVPPEEVYPRPKPRAGFYGGDSPLPSGSGKVVALVGVVAGILLAFGVAAWLVATPKEQQTPYVGPATIAQGHSAARPDQVPAPIQPTAEPPTRAESPNSRGAASPTESQRNPANVLAPSAPPIGNSPQIIASGDGLNKHIYLSSELALSGYDNSGKAVLSDDQVRAAFEAISAAATISEPKTLEQLQEWFETTSRATAQAERLRGHLWHQRNRPTFTLPLSGVPASGIEVEVLVRCKDQASRELLIGGAATSPSPAMITPSESGDCEIPLLLRINESNAVKLATPQQANLTIDVRFKQSGKEIGRQELPHSITVYPTSFVEMEYPRGYAYATTVNEDHRWVKDLIEAVNAGPFCRRMNVLIQGDCDLRGVFALWRELSARGIRYSDIASTSNPDAQEVRAFHDALTSRNANCADGTALLCSLLAKSGASPTMVLVRGHVFVGLPFQVPLWFQGEWNSDSADFRSGKWVRSEKPLLQLGLEATRLGTGIKCSEDFRRNLLECFKHLKEFDATLATSDKGEWLTFLGALEAGTKQIQEQYFKAAHGQGRVPSLLAICEEIRRAWEGELRDENGNPLSEEGVDEILKRDLKLLSFNFMNLLSIDQARKDGVRPVGYDNASVPKDGIGPLRSK